ncbi:MAG TPA: YifB family Mg chelatase-like AAA ATPase [Anaerolineae bacterium]|nr:YifB family Mg chelatase-like AAA ATPase [Anaerolineae bacterium]
MLARIWSCALTGLEGEIVQVEVDIHHGLPATTIVGLPDAAVRESKDRLYAALRNAGFAYPMARITVNLAPADVRKAGPAYDLPIALGILMASEQLDADLSDAIVVGEMALDGALRATQGILPIVQAARSRGFKRVLVPADNAAEAALVMGRAVMGAAHIVDLVRHLVGGRPLPIAIAPALTADPPPEGMDMALVRGQEQARRALEIAAAGGHNLLFSGPPGSGKTMLARCLPGILPPLTLDEALEVTAVYSVAGLLSPETPLIRSRPFRSPHHTISAAGLIGGGTWPGPGEVSKAHHGVLFLDELPEFDARILEVLRQPLEDRHVTIARAAGAATFPASFTLVAARNPCPCGHHGDPGQACSCGPGAVQRYQQRISGPLLDRIDMHVEVPRVDHARLLDATPAEGSAAVRARVMAARLLQQRRLERAAWEAAAGDGTVDREAVDGETGETPASRAAGLAGRTVAAGEGPATPRRPGRMARATPATRLPPRQRQRPTAPRCNSEMGPAEIRAHCHLTPEALELMQAGLRQLRLSARAYYRVLKLARTIADLEAETEIQAAHLAEALQYRPRTGEG